MKGKIRHVITNQGKNDKPIVIEDRFSACDLLSALHMGLMKQVAGVINIAHGPVTGYNTLKGRLRNIVECCLDYRVLP